jgi:hypothetical protein
LIRFLILSSFLAAASSSTHHPIYSVNAGENETLEGNPESHFGKVCVHELEGKERERERDERK